MSQQTALDMLLYTTQEISTKNFPSSFRWCCNQLQHSYVANSFSVLGICGFHSCATPKQQSSLILFGYSSVGELVRSHYSVCNMHAPLQIDAPMELQSCNVLLNCNDTWKDSHILDGMDRETHFRMRQTAFGNCSVTVKGVRNGVNVAMGTTSVQSQCPCPTSELF